MNVKRPDMREYFTARINWHVHGLLARSVRYPADVVRIVGDVTDQVISVTTRDGSVFSWSGGRYAARKINGCYAPLMPTPISEQAGA